MQATRPASAALAAVGGMATLGITDNTVPFISDDGSLWQFHALRSAISLVLLCTLAVLFSWRARPLNWTGVLGRSFFPAAAMILYFGCVGMMPITAVVAGFFTAPIWVLLIAIVFQKKTVGPARWSAVALGFGGVLTVMGAGLDVVAWGAMLLIPMAAGLLYGIGGVATRAWCEGERALTLTVFFFLYLGIFGLIGLLIFPIEGVIPPDGPDGFVLRGWGPVDGALWFWMAVQGVGSIIGIGLLFQAYLWGEASRVVIFEYSFLIFASLGALLFWADPITPVELLGMAMVIGAGVIIAMRDQA